MRAPGEAIEIAVAPLTLSDGGGWTVSGGLLTAGNGTTPPYADASDRAGIYGSPDRQGVVILILNP